MRALILALLLSVPAFAAGQGVPPWGSVDAATLKKIAKTLHLTPTQGVFPEDASWVQLKNRPGKTYFVTFIERSGRKCDYVVLDANLKVLARIPTQPKAYSCERPAGVLFMDVNGDGAEDMVAVTWHSSMVADSGTFGMGRVVLNTKKGFVTDPALDKKVAAVSDPNQFRLLEVAKAHFKGQ